MAQSRQKGEGTADSRQRYPAPQKVAGGGGAGRGRQSCPAGVLAALPSMRDDNERRFAPQICATISRQPLNAHTICNLHGKQAASKHEAKRLPGKAVGHRGLVALLSVRLWGVFRLISLGHALGEAEELGVEG